MQVVLFLSFVVGDVTASIVLFRIAPFNPICIWYPSLLVYGMGHLVTSLIMVVVIGLIWCLLGNHAAWESICRTRQRGRVLYQAAFAGLAIDLCTSIAMRYIEPRGDTPHYGISGNVALWLLLRAGIWTIAYAVMGYIFLLIFHLKLKSRRMMESQGATRSR